LKKIEIKNKKIKTKINKIMGIKIIKNIKRNNIRYIELK